jgi:NADPH2:quinone reductase
MRAAELRGVGEIAVGERPRPIPGPDEVLVEVGACGVCMTDYHMYHGTFEVETPMIPGHESAGTVVEVGESVRRYESGDRVAINPTVPCTACPYCKRGETHLCAHNTSIGGAADSVIDGAFAEYVRVPETNVEPIGDLPARYAALAEPLACAVHGAAQAGCEPGDSVALIGAGPVGLLLLQTFRLAGAAPIVVSEPDEDRRELAADLGADAVVDPDSADPVDRIRDVADGPVDIGVEAIGLGPTLEQAHAVTAPGGTTLVFGVPDRDATIEINPFEVFFEEISVQGSYSLTTADFGQAVTLLRHGRIDVAPLISHEIGLTDLGAAFDRMGNVEGLKHVVIPE